MEELFKEFDKLNVNNDYTLTIMYTKYLEWSIDVVYEGNGWSDATKIIVDAYGKDKTMVIKKVIEVLKNYKKPVDK